MADTNNGSENILANVYGAVTNRTKPLYESPETYIQNVQMKRLRSSNGTLSLANAAHPLVQILTQRNYSTIRKLLYDACECPATYWALTRIVPGIIYTLNTSLLSDELDAVLDFRHPTGDALRNDVMTVYKNQIKEKRHLKYEIISAFESNAPLQFLTWMWDTYYTAAERNEYVYEFFFEGGEQLGFKTSNDNRDTVIFFWNKIILPNIKTPRVNKKFIRLFIYHLYVAKFSFDTVHWIWSHFSIEPEKCIPFLTLYEMSMDACNFQASKAFWMYASSDLKAIIRGIPLVPYAKFIQNVNRYQVSGPERHDILRFCVDAHGYCAYAEFWTVAWEFTYTMEIYDPLYLALFQFHEMIAANISRKTMAFSILQTIESSIVQNGGTPYVEFIHLLNAYFQPLTCQFQEPWIFQWMHDICIKYPNRPGILKNWVHVSTMLKLSPTIVRQFEDAIISAAAQ